MNICHSRALDRWRVTREENLVISKNNLRGIRIEPDPLLYTFPLLLYICSLGCIKSQHKIYIVLSAIVLEIMQRPLASG